MTQTKSLAETLEQEAREAEKNGYHKLRIVTWQASSETSRKAETIFGVRCPQKCHDVVIYKICAEHKAGKRCEFYCGFSFTHVYCSFDMSQKESGG